MLLILISYHLSFLLYFFPFGFRRLSCNSFQTFCRTYDITQKIWGKLYKNEQDCHNLAKYVPCKDIKKIATKLSDCICANEKHVLACESVNLSQCLILFLSQFFQCSDIFLLYSVVLLGNRTVEKNLGAGIEKSVRLPSQKKFSFVLK